MRADGHSDWRSDEEAKLAIDKHRLIGFVALLHVARRS